MTKKRLYKMLRGPLWRLHNRLRDRGVCKVHIYFPFSNLGCPGLRLGPFYADLYPRLDGGYGLFLCVSHRLRAWINPSGLSYEHIASSGKLTEYSSRRHSNVN